MFKLFSLTDLVGLLRPANDEAKLSNLEKDQQKKLDALFETRGSLMKLLEPFLVEPTLFLTKNAMYNSNGKYQDAITDQIDYFTNIYCQAFKVLTGMYGISPILSVNLLKTTGYGHNPVQYGLDKVKKIIRKEVKASFESAYCHAEAALRNLQDKKFLSFNVSSESKDDGSYIPVGHGAEVKLGDSTRKTVDDVGIAHQIRHFTIKIPNGTQQVQSDGSIKTLDIEIPITVKCNIIVLDIEQLNNALDSKKDANSLYNRILEYRSGGISFTELLFATDLIEAYSKSKKKDKDDIIDILNSREFSSYANAIADGSVGNLQLPVGYERFYNLFCITETELKLLELAAGGSIDKPATKEKMFSKLNAQQVMVLDTELDTAKLYLQAFPQPSIVPFSKLGKRKGGKGEIDMTDLFQALLASNKTSTPVF